jgi:dihydrofolate synthase/folylpolyglutamate synthase
VVGVSRDKNAGEIVRALAPSFDTIICTAAHHKGADAKDIAASVRKAHPKAAVHVAATIEEAADVSRSLAAAQTKKIYVAGGLFLAVEYATIANGGRAEELNFF